MSLRFCRRWPFRRPGPGGDVARRAARSRRRPRPAPPRPSITSSSSSSHASGAARTTRRASARRGWRPFRQPAACARRRTSGPATASSIRRRIAGAVGLRESRRDRSWAWRGFSAAGQLELRPYARRERQDDTPKCRRRRPRRTADRLRKRDPRAAACSTRSRRCSRRSGSRCTGSWPGKAEAREAVENCSPSAAARPAAATSPSPGTSTSSRRARAGTDEPTPSPRRRGGLLYGRGAVDMKGSIAAMVAALAEVPAEAGTISLIITGDEEGRSPASRHCE